MGFYFLSLIFSKHTKVRAFRLRKNWLRIALRILNIHVEKKGKSHSKPSLYVCNHRSFSDPLVVLRFLNAFVIAKAEVEGYPIINKGAELTGIVYVDRNNKNSREATRQKMVEVLQEGYNVLVYPEGTVGKNLETLPFKKGTFMEAAKHGIPVVPIAVEYKSGKDLWLIPNFIKHYLQQFSKWKTEVKCTFGPVIKSDDGSQLHIEAHRWINQEIQKMQTNWSEFAKKDTI
jgi:1-acyl-sn-glycerol-3-phosphate acyltransferase